jgi:hypothetical protein
MRCIMHICTCYTLEKRNDFHVYNIHHILKYIAWGDNSTWKGFNKVLFKEGEVRSKATILSPTKSLYSIIEARADTTREISKSSRSSSKKLLLFSICCPSCNILLLYNNPSPSTKLEKEPPHPLLVQSVLNLHAAQPNLQALALLFQF